ncbi:MAG: hypothetical protein H3C38_08050 [Rhodospirillales bacterium]|nr:hypothetical protein [Rhodospirillales bacterium]
MAAILAFRSARTKQNWTNDELAELYRVVDILGRAGLQVDTEAGLSDEGDPWFLFCRADTGDVIAHFARIDGQFIAASAAIDETFRGASFRQIIDQMVDRQPLMLPRPAKSEKLFLHPAVVLTAFVATALQQMQNWDAEEVGSPVEARIGPEAGKPVEKSALMEALSAAFRGGPPSPADDKNSHSEFAAASIQGLSLASVVAFAMSVVQGQPTEDHDTPQQTDRIAANEISSKTVSVVAAAPTVEPHSSGESDRHDGEAAQEVTGDPPAKHEHDGDKGDRLVAEVKPDPAGTHVVNHDGGENLAQKALQNDAEIVRFQVADAEPASIDLIQVAEVKEVTPVAADAVKIEFPKINFAEISKEALDIFFLDLPGETTDGGGSIVSAVPLAPSEPSLLPDIAPGTGVDPLPGIRQPSTLRAADIVFAGNDQSVAPLLTTITDFVYSPDSWVEAPILSASLNETLRKYAVDENPLTLVVYDSSDLALDVFAFTPGVLFVEESKLPSWMDYADDPAVVDLANGGSITLMGVMTIDHAFV